MTAAASTETLTPSEVVLLHGDRFAKKAMLGEKLLLTDMKVSTAELALTMIAAAILANEKRGLINLTLKKERTLFGLASRETLKIASVGSGTIGWSPASTESGILAELGNKEKDVSAVVIGFLGREANDPEGDYISRVKATLASRGIISRDQKKVLGLNVSVAYSMTGAQKSIITASGADEVVSLIDGTKQGRPDIWKRLHDEVSAAFDNRTASSSGPD